MSNSQPVFKPKLGFIFSAMLIRQTRWLIFYRTQRCQTLSSVPRYQTFKTFTPRLERLRPAAVPLRSSKNAKSSEDKLGKHFVDYCRVKVKVLFF